MKIICSPEELVKLAKELALASEPKQYTVPATKRQPIAGLNAPPSKEMTDYLATVGQFAMEYSTEPMPDQSGPSSSESDIPAANPESTSDHHN